jgi:plasmid stability protein
MLSIVATIIVRNLDDEVAERLRPQARLRGISVEQEARRILAEGTRLRRAEIAARAAAIRRPSPPRGRAPGPPDLEPHRCDRVRRAPR